MSFSYSIDIFHAYVALLKQTKTALLPQLALAAQNNSNDTEMMDLGEESGSANKLMRQVIKAEGVSDLEFRHYEKAAKYEKNLSPVLTK